MKSQSWIHAENKSGQFARANSSSLSEMVVKSVCFGQRKITGRLARLCTFREGLLQHGLHEDEFAEEQALIRDGWQVAQCSDHLAGPTLPAAWTLKL